MPVKISPYPPEPLTLFGQVRAVLRELRGTHDAMGKPQRVLGVTMRGVPGHRRDHKWALVRQVRGELWRLAARRRRAVVGVCGVVAIGAYAGALGLHDGTPDGVVAVLGVVGLLGVVGVGLGMLVNAPVEVRRMCVLSHGVCAGCMGRLTRSCASGLACCEECGAAWDGREVFEGQSVMGVVCGRCEGVCEKPARGGGMVCEGCRA